MLGISAEENLLKDLVIINDKSSKDAETASEDGGKDDMPTLDPLVKVIRGSGKDTTSKPVNISMQNPMSPLPSADLTSPTPSIDGDAILKKKKEKKKRTFRRLLYFIIEGGWSPFDVIFSAILFILIVESVVIFVVGTLPDLPNGLAVTFPVLDGINIVIFTIEYLLRVYCSIERKSLRIHGPILGRLLYCIRILPLLDLISLLVYLFSFVWNLAGWQTIPQVYSIFRLGRLLLLIRAEKHLQAVKTLMRIFTDKRDILLAGMFVSLVVWITSSCLLYYTEKDASPVDFPDILASMMIMLRIVTAYGIPVDNLTTPGMVIVGINCFVAIYVFGIPAMIILYGYEEASEKVRKEYLRTSAGSESDSDDDPPQKDENEFPFKSLKDVTAPNWCHQCAHCLKKVEMLENLEKLRRRKLVKQKKQGILLEDIKKKATELRNLSETANDISRKPLTSDLIPDQIILI